VVDDEGDDFAPIRIKSERRWNSLRLIAHGFTWGLLLALLACVVPKVEAVFADFGVPLPNVTMLVIEASHWLVAAMAMTVSLLIADWFVMNHFARCGDRVGARSWSLLMIATPFVMAVVTLGALVLPMLTITQRLSG
jgi:type II secretory pathway component PulF